mmetsp:Transcript_22693/g.62652  ORF Transcript_22693/g.62652 Transcript_22693/m.62652 type:complete len:129 (-) Transcript_22693:420-806(-)|eukprot:CAMPEP_0202346462 /NCGR_PEP_ID=MMETSP1126-20121109/5244_1 /ASSEMBLY_ACC=CAM_ASM_000457 /TAXON_ID=3047 /ORGANISM="Dunaliella tertiolecta, Strain CCMP1320" /LENGTH=128 /DNA_ID=CAMNT_0048937877 /DNA_START=73 /DNA_END=459 /DNA_ORIENTATION=-
MALLQKSSLQMRAAAPARRTSVVVRAEKPAVQDRRAFMGAAFVGILGSAAAIAPAAEAIELPWQKSTGGMATGGGSMTKSATTATAQGYTNEGYPGTKRPSYISPKEKRLLKQEARERAEREAAGIRE